MRIVSVTPTIFFVIAISLLFYSTLNAASQSPPESWKDLPAMYDKGTNGQQNLRWYTDLKQKKVFTFSSLLEQIKSESDGRFEWIADEKEGYYRLKTVFLRKIKEGKTKLTPIELTFRSCLNTEKNQKGVELVEILNPEQQNHDREKCRWTTLKVVQTLFLIIQ